MPTLTPEQIEYLVSRCDENSYGKCIVTTRLIKKYREYTGDMSSNDVIRAMIQNLYIQHK